MNNEKLEHFKFLAMLDIHWKMRLLFDDIANDRRYIAEWQSGRISGAVSIAAGIFNEEPFLSIDAEYNEKYINLK